MQSKKSDSQHKSAVANNTKYIFDDVNDEEFDAFNDAFVGKIIDTMKNIANNREERAESSQNYSPILCPESMASKKIVSVNIPASSDSTIKGRTEIEKRRRGDSEIPFCKEGS